MAGHGAPQVGDGHPDPAEQVAGQRQRDAQHVGRVAVDTVDEPAAEAVDGQRTGDARAVRRWRCRRRVPHRSAGPSGPPSTGFRGAASSRPPTHPPDGMAGDQHAVPAGHLPPARPGLVGVRRFALAVRRRSAASSRSRRRRRRRGDVGQVARRQPLDHGIGLRLGERPDPAPALWPSARVGEHGVLVDPGHRDHRVQARRCAAPSSRAGEAEASSSVVIAASRTPTSRSADGCRGMPSRCAGSPQIDGAAGALPRVGARRCWRMPARPAPRPRPRRRVPG